MRAHAKFFHGFLCNWYMGIYMKDMKTAMKYSMILGLVGAVLIPLLYECYANISRMIALILIAAWTVFVGLKFSKLDFKPATLGISATLAYTGVLGLIGYVIIHPAIQHFLTKNSKYFQLTLKDQTMFVLYTAIILICMYIVCYIKYSIVMVLKQIHGNVEKTSAYIDNAFNDEEKS